MQQFAYRLEVTFSTALLHNLPTVFESAFTDDYG